MGEELLFCCPLCGGPLVRQEHRAACSQGHSFDIARQGYVHLLPVNRMHAKVPGDSREMVESRRRFLEGGWYAPFQEALCRLAKECAGALGSPQGAGLVRCDAGCGEGDYTAALRAALPEARACGFDISKLAVKAAAGKHKGIQLAVASSFQIPLGEGSVQILTDVFSPLAEEEFARVVGPGGFFLYAVPGERHLYGLKEVLYEAPYENPRRDTAYRGFQFIKREEVRGRISLPGGQAVRDLFAMTPYYWKTGVEGARRLESLPSLETEIAFDFLLYKRLSP